MYPLSPSAGFRSPYPTSLPISTSSLPGDFYRFSPTGLIPPHPGLSPHGPLSSHPAIVTPGPKQELPDLNHRYGRYEQIIFYLYFVVIGTVIENLCTRILIAFSSSHTQTPKPLAHSTVLWLLNSTARARN